MMETPGQALNRYDIPQNSENCSCAGEGPSWRRLGPVGGRSPNLSALASRGSVSADGSAEGAGGEGVESNSGLSGLAGGWR
jgi:hypothetical protein